MALFLILIAVPLIEIGLFVQVGGAIGLWSTLGIVLLTALIGTALVRTQGMQALARLQASMGGQGDPAEALVHGAMILFAGALLLTPGFFTDAVGFALLVPQVRMAAFARAKAHMAKGSVHVHMAGFGHGPAAGQSRGGDTIEGEFTEVDPDAVPPKPGSQPSGWTRNDT